MARLLVRKQRKMLRGWIKWVPVVVIPFGVLFVHAWLNIQILRADYVLRELDKESKVLQDQLRHAGVAQAAQQSPEVLAAQADEMQFVLPKPGQLELISYDPATVTRLPEEAAFEMARRSPEVVELRGPTLDASPMPVEPRTEMASLPGAVTLSDAGPMSDLPAPPAAPSVPETAPSVPAPPVPAPSVPAPVAEASSPVWAALDTNTPASVAVPVSLPGPQKTPVVLDLPEDAYVEELPGLEADMGTLETL